MAVPQTIQQQLTVAREHALMGDYDSAAVYYKSVVAQVQGYALGWWLTPDKHKCMPAHNTHRYSPVSDAARSKWNGLRKLVQDELNIVAKLSKEKNGLVKTAGPLLATNKVHIGEGLCGRQWWALACVALLTRHTHGSMHTTCFSFFPAQERAEYENRPYNGARPHSPHVQVFTVRAFAAAELLQYYC